MFMSNTEVDNSFKSDTYKCNESWIIGGGFATVGVISIGFESGYKLLSEEMVLAVW